MEKFFTFRFITNYERFLIYFCISILSVTFFFFSIGQNPIDINLGLLCNFVVSNIYKIYSNNIYLCQMNVVNMEGIFYIVRFYILFTRFNPRLKILQILIFVNDSILFSKTRRDKFDHLINPPLSEI